MATETFIVEGRDKMIDTLTEYPLRLHYVRDGLTGPRFEFKKTNQGHIFSDKETASKQAEIAAEAMNKRWNGLKKIEYRVLSK